MGVRAVATVMLLKTVLIALIAMAPSAPRVLAQAQVLARTLPAPFQVDGVRLPVDEEDPATLGAPWVLVDLGPAEGHPRPRREDHVTMTLLGTSGAIELSLLEIAKVCGYLCGDEIEECSYEGRYAPAGDLARVGTPLAALPGRHALADYGPLAEIPAAASGSSLPRTGEEPEITSPIWPAEPGVRAGQRLRRDGDGLIFDQRWGPSELVHSIPLSDCSLSRRGPLERLRCSGFEALLAGGRLLLTSVDDYGAAGADVLATFEHEGRVYLVVRLGLKAQTVYGLLVREGESWRALIHPREHALIC